MDKLREYIKDHESEFQYLTPPEGHRERFEAKLSRRRKQRTMADRSRGMWAALVAALLVVGLAILIRPSAQSPVDGEDAFADIDIRDEMQQAEWYYSMRIEDIASQVDAIARENADVPQIADIVRDCDKVMADCHEFRTSVYPDLETTEASLYAITCQYSSSIEALNFMIEKMKYIKEQEL